MLSDQEQEPKDPKESDPDGFLRGVDAELVHKSERGNELYVVNEWYSDGSEAYFLRYMCPSTGRVYVKGLRPDIAWKNADSAQAWSFGLTHDEYRNLTAES